MTVLWATVGIALRSFIPNGQNKGVVQICLALTAVCCWLLWLVAYMAQMNPLFGPQLNNVTLSLMNRFQHPA